MSAWIVSHECMDRILSNLHGKYEDYVPEFKKYSKDELGQKLLRMNIDAVNQRYSEQKDYSHADSYKFKPIEVSVAQSFLSACCLGYQCSEGDVPKRKLFKQLEKLENGIACAIAHDKADEEKCEWGL